MMLLLKSKCGCLKHHTFMEDRYGSPEALISLIGFSQRSQACEALSRQYMCSTHAEVTNNPLCSCGR